MALLYLNAGHRRYGQQAVAIYPRKWWAFQFIHRGAATMTFLPDRTLRMEGSWLTVAGPDLAHGWGGRPEDECEVIVFHFDEIPAPLARAIGPQGLARFPVDDATVALGRQWYERCAPRRREAEREVHSHVVAGELSLCVLQRLPDLPLPPETARLKVERALAWYAAHLPEAPTVEEVAAAVHLSPAHLRRLFHQVRGASPHQAMDRVRFERAIHLMRDPALTLETIAENAGFGSASAFSRAFRTAYHQTPGDYRRSALREP